MKYELVYDVHLLDLLNRDGMSRRDVAQMIGVSKDAIRQMELNERDIYLKKINGEWHYCEVRPWRRMPKPHGGRGRPFAENHLCAS